MALLAGCGVASLALGASGCAATSEAALPLVRVHAEKDLDCGGDDIRITEELGGRYKAVGCGRKAVYRTACVALSCTVQPESAPAIPWRDRPPPKEDGTPDPPERYVR